MMRKSYGISLCLLALSGCATSPGKLPEKVVAVDGKGVKSDEAAVTTTASSATGKEESTTFFDAANEQDSAEERLSRLEKVIGKSPEKEALVADVRAVLEAEVFDQAQDFEQALAKWRKALDVARGQLGRKALRGWILAYYQLMDKNQTPEAVADVLLKDVQGSTTKTYLSESGLNTTGALAKQIRDVLQSQNPNEYLTPTGISFVPPEAGVTPAGDATLEKAAKVFCQDQNPDMIAVDNWVGSFPEGVRGYWDALAFKCRLQTADALEQIRTAIPALLAAETTQSLGVRALELEIDWLKQQGERTLMIESYVRLVDALYLPGVKGSGLGLDPFAFRLARIDQVLNAARYKTLVADYSKAKTFVDQATADIKASREQDQALAGFSAAKLDNLQADAWHTVAFRIFVEQGKFEDAVRISEDALLLPELNSEWKERLNWNVGLYHYLAGNYAKAGITWEGMVMGSLGDTQKATLLFWLSKAFAAQNNPTKAAEYEQKLLAEQPFSFYGVYLQDQKKPTDWKTFFSQFPQYAAEVKTPKKFDEKAVLADPVLGKEWARVSVLMEAELRDFYEAALEQAGKSLKKNRKLSQETLPAYLYYTRLAAKAGRYFEAIQTTGQMVLAFPNFWSMYPEQMEVIYPLKHYESIQKFAAPRQVATETVLAVMRQESSFQVDIKSGAGAIGLMQVMPATAEKIARDQSYIYEDVHKALYKPEFNVAVGSAYLQALQKVYPEKPGAVYAAYNAGEPAVNSWLSHRGQKDLLAWIELIPFGETRQYVKNVWRNQIIYSNILKSQPKS